MFLLEKQHLKPVSHLTLFEGTSGLSITRTVNKDNTVHYKSNRYSVPLGTYRPKGLNKVSIEIHKDEANRQQLVITRYPEGEILAKHPIELTKGKLIKNRNHSRDRSKGIQAYKETVIRQFKNAELATSYIDEVLENYPRYKRDQLRIFHTATIDYSASIDSALQKCVDEHLVSANDFSDVAKYLSTLSTEELQPQDPKPVQSTSCNIRVATRPISTYTNILGGVVS